QIQKSQQQTVPDVFNHARAPLIEVRATENHADYHQAHDPRRLRIPEYAGHAVHEVTAIDDLLSQGSQRPKQKQVDQHQLQISHKVREVGQVRHLSKPPGQQRLGDKELQRFHAKA